MNKQLNQLQEARNKAIYDLGIIDIKKKDLENQRENIFNFLQKLAQDEHELQKNTLETIPESPLNSPQQASQQSHNHQSHNQQSPSKSRPKNSQKTKDSKESKESKNRINLEISGEQIIKNN